MKKNPAEFSNIVRLLEEIQDELIDVTKDTKRAEAIRALSCAALGLAHGGDITSCDVCPEWGQCRILPEKRRWLVITISSPEYLTKATLVEAGGVVGALRAAGIKLAEEYLISEVGGPDRCWTYLPDDKNDDRVGYEVFATIVVRQ